MVTLKSIDLSSCPNEAFARDVFLLSFYLQGMSLVDVANLKKSDKKNGLLVYHRRKTGARISIEWLPCMQEIICRYHQAGSDYLLPIINAKQSEEKQRKIYLCHLQHINKALKNIAKKWAVM